MTYNLVISGTIGSWWSGCSADYVRYVLNQNKGKEVHVGFCSLGGFVKDGLEINQAFRDHGNVHAHAFGMNASISTIAMLGCKSIDIVKGSFFLIHNVSVLIDKYEQSNKEQIDALISKLKEQRDSLKTFDDVLAAMYADKTGKTVDECLAQMKRGNWLSARQALDFGSSTLYAMTRRRRRRPTSSPGNLSIHTTIPNNSRMQAYRRSRNRWPRRMPPRAWHPWLTRAAIQLRAFFRRRVRGSRVSSATNTQQKILVK